MGKFAKKMRKGKKKGIASFKRDVRKSIALDFIARMEVELAEGRACDDVIGYLGLIWAYVLNRDYHYGKERLMRVFEKVLEFAEDIRTGWSPTEEWEKALQEEAGFTYPMPKTDGLDHIACMKLEEIHRQMIIYSCALFVGFGFAQKRLQKCTKAVSNISLAIKNGEVEELDMYHTLKKKKIVLEQVIAKAKIELRRKQHEQKKTQKKTQSRYQAGSVLGVA